MAANPRWTDVSILSLSGKKKQRGPVLFPILDVGFPKFEQTKTFVKNGPRDANGGGGDGPSSHTAIKQSGIRQLFIETGIPVDSYYEWSTFLILMELLIVLVLHTLSGQNVALLALCIVAYI